MTLARARIAFATSNGSCGGSEDLWSGTAVALARDGHDVRVYKPRFDPEFRALGQLRALGCRPVELSKLPLLPPRINPSLRRFSRRLARGYGIARFAMGLRQQQPDLVVISQGASVEGLWLARACASRQIPYVQIVQHASEYTWLSSRERWQRHRLLFQQARHLFFVSNRTRELTEEQLGLRFAHASVVRNCFRVPWQERDDWPGGSGLRLACVGRLDPFFKGQDILLRVLAREKWRGRPVDLTFFGSGPHDKALRGMAAYLGLERVRFAGHVADPAAIWDDHHGLALPSRAEGMPLVVVEAMLSGRVPIVTAVSGNPELVEDGVTGFLADAATEAAYDEALERAWQQRDRLATIGRSASEAIRRLLPPDPARQFADALLSLIERGRSA